MKKFLVTASLTLTLMVPSAHAEVVQVKYLGPVDLGTFSCADTASSFVHRICYDAEDSHVVVLLRNTYYHYCGVDPKTVHEWLTADSKGRFYNQRIKEDASGGKFSCAN